MDVKKLGKDDLKDFRNLITIFNEVFENNNELPNNEHLLKLLSLNDFDVFVVRQNGVILGGLTAYILHSYYTENSIAYIYDVGITPNSQGKGAGKFLMNEFCKYCQMNGYIEAFVEAESEDIPAIIFYRKTNYTHELSAIQFTYKL